MVDCSVLQELSRTLWDSVGGWGHYGGLEAQQQASRHCRGLGALWEILSNMETESSQEAWGHCGRLRNMVDKYGLGGTMGGIVGG